MEQPRGKWGFQILSITCLLVATFVGCNRSQEKSPLSDNTVVFRSFDGRFLTVADLRKTNARGDSLQAANVPPEAIELHQIAREEGGRGEYEQALAHLQQAATLAPGWPYPVYDMAFTHLLREEYADAARYYQQTVEMAPRGFFTAITAANTLQRELNGEFPPGTYLAYLSLEWIDDPAKMTERLHSLVENVPTFAPAWEKLATLADNDTERLAAIEKGLAAHPDAETWGVLEANKALILDRQGNHARAIEMLGEIVLDSTSTSATEMMARALLLNILEGRR